MGNTEITTKTGFCSLCRSRCGATYTIKDGQLTSAGPAPDHPTGSALCLKGKAAPEIIYSPERILHPMRRTTPKTDPNPGWERISWDEALGEVASKFNEIKRNNGAESVAFAVTSPSGSTISDNIDWIERFIRKFGSPNTAYATEICNWHKDHAHKFTFGSGILYPEYAKADTILLWGFNPSATWLDQATQIANARARGAKIMSVDPRNSGYARDADHWLRILPGSDGILAMGIANLMIQRNGYNDAFVRHWSNGPFLVRDDTGEFLRAKDIGAEGDGRYVVAKPDGQLIILDERIRNEDTNLSDVVLEGNIAVETVAGKIICRPAFDLYAEACRAYSLERVSQETTIPTDAIEAAAEALIKAKSVAYYAWNGVAQHSNAVQTDRAIAMLMSLKGCYDAPGGNVAYSKHVTNAPTNFNQWPEGQLAKALGAKERPLGPASQGWVAATDLYSAILTKKPYPIRAMMVFGANLAVSHGETVRGKAALEALEFHVHCDAIETPTASYADIFLPVNTAWEREGLRVGFEVSQDAEELIQLRQPMIDSQGESRSDREILFDLAQRVGLSEEFYGGDIDKALSAMLEPTGVSLEELRAHPEGIKRPLSYKPKKYAEQTDGKLVGFATDTGRVEIYSELFLRHGYDPIPRFEAPERGDADFPFVLTTAKSGYYNHSSQRHIPSLRKRLPEPYVELCSETADNNGFAADDMMRIETASGEIRMKLRINDSLHPDVAVASYGWWQANERMSLPGFDPYTNKGSNYNRLITAEKSDPISGAVPHRSARCKLSLLDSTMAALPSWKGFASATVTSVETVADDVTQVSIKIDDLSEAPDYLPGQHIVLSIDGANGASKLTRCYSLVGEAVNSQRSEYVIAVRRVLAPAGASDLPPGEMSGYINDGLKPGTKLAIKAPAGRFVMPVESDAPIVLIAGGIGITPFLSYLETVAKSKIQPRIHLVYANRNGRVHAFRKRLLELKAAIPTLTVSNIYNEPLTDDLKGVEFDRSGFVSAGDILLSEFDTAPNVFQCGPPPMMAAVEKALAENGHPAELLHKEAFTSPVATNPIPKGPFKVTFAKSGKTVVWTQASGSLLDLGEAEGITLNSGCRAGQCESCVQTVVTGDVTYRTDLEFNENDRCLTCQAVPTTDLTLDV
jgi:anaerobic selenocysteine-containing dehydrogenase/ferredoxin-NADP reductase